MADALLILDCDGGDGAPLARALDRRGVGPIALVDCGRDPADFVLAGARIVNGALATRGDRSQRGAINEILPVRWASAARSAGAQHFIQVSSFSVYGHCELIDTGTAVAPYSDYGRQRLAADRAILGLGDSGFVPTVVRIPALIGTGSDKLSDLVRLACRLGVAPVAPWPCPRSMLSVDGLAAVIEAQLRSPCPGVLHAADPTPFSVDLLIRVARGLQRRIRPLQVPGSLLAPFARMAPGMHASLFRASQLAETINAAPKNSPYERLEEVVARDIAACAPGLSVLRARQ